MALQTTFIYSLFCLVLLLSVSCKKQKDIYPEVEILSPNVENTYLFGDTIYVTARVHNADRLAVVNVYDGSHNLGLSYNRVCSSNTDEQKFEIYFDNKYVESGQYNIRVSASNGKNTLSDFQSVILRGLRLKKIGLVVLTNDGSQRKLLVRDTTGGLSEFVLPGDFEYLEYNSRIGMAIVAPRFQGNLSGFSINPLTEEFQKNTSSVGGLPKFSELIDDGMRIFSLSGSGDIKAYGQNGMEERSYSMPTDKLPVNGCMGESGMVVASRDNGTSIYSIQLLNPTNGAVLKTKVVNGEVADLVSVGNSIFVVALKKAGQTYLYNYWPSTNSLTSMFVLTGEPVCLFSNGGVVFISTSSAVYSFIPESGAQPVLLYNFSVSDFDFDYTTNELILATEDKVFRAVSGGSLSLVAQFSAPVLQVEMAYNK